MTINHQRSYILLDNSIARILNDLKNGNISVAATHEEIQNRYPLGGDNWRAYREARRDFAFENGCLVICDEISGEFIIAHNDISGEIEPDAAYNHFLSASRERLESGENFRLAMYRLPSGDYSDKSQDYFMKHGEYLWTYPAKTQQHVKFS
ncbi:hypothetical protein LJR231_005522 [Phyllobacterium sp. LjRoot231]|uniref:hypothetical protein n=1 Tax=Phyllobacterium sp. LjRoot231 TaxID=3342289 RepID=UPI003ECDBE92